MCGRTACGLDPDQMCAACSHQLKGASVQFIDPKGFYSPNYNQCPSQRCAILVSCRHTMLSDSVACANSKYMLMPMSWGLVPQYAKHQSPGGGATSKPPNNARLDTLQKTLKTNKGMFRNALVNNQRCIMVVDGFYEWKREGTQKQPMLFYHSQSSHIQLHRPELESIDAGEWRGRRPMLLASIFDVNSNDASFAVITTDAPDWFNVIHSRMPVSRLCCILQLFKAVLDNHDDIVKWLNPTIDSVDALQLIAPESTVEFMSHMVDAKYVNNVRCRDNDCVCPILSSTDEHQLNIEENKNLLKHKKKFGTPPRNTLTSYFSIIPKTESMIDDGVETKRKKCD